MKNSAKEKLEHMERKTGQKRNAHTVLYALCYQLNDTPEEEDINTVGETADETIDSELFETLMANDSGEENTEYLAEYAPIRIVFDDFEVFAFRNFQSQFMEACLNIRGPASIIGRRQAGLYCKMMKIPYLIKNGSKKVSMYREQRKTSIEKPNLCMPYATNKVLELEVDISDMNFLFLFRLDVMDKHSHNLLVFTSPKWSSPITRKFGHIFYE